MRLMIRSVGLFVLLLVLCTPLYAQEGGRVYYDFGVFAFEDGDYADAESNFKKALSFEPDNPYYNQYLGRTYLKTERFAESAPLLEKAWNVDPELSGIKYDLATLYFKQENYPEAARFYAEAAEDDPEDVLARYYAGISELKLENYAKALDYLVAASDRSPTIKENGYYYAGICHLKIGQPAKAVEKFTYVRDNAQSATLKKNAEHWLAAAESQQKALKPYALYFQLGYMYDSNVLLEPIDQDLPSEESDGAVVGYLSGRYDFIKNDSLTAGAGYGHYSLDYQRLEDFDFTASIPQFYIRHRMRPMTLSLTYLPNYYWLKREDYLMKHQIRPDLLWDINADLRLSLAYTYEVKNYFTAPDRTGHASKYDADLYYSLPGKMGQVYGGGGTEHSIAAVGTQNYRRSQGRLGTVVSLPWALRLQAVGKITQKQYLKANPFFGGETRKDTTIDAMANLSRSIFYDWLRVIGEYRYSKNDSNIVKNNVEVFDYVRHQVTVSLAASF